MLLATAGEELKISPVVLNVLSRSSAQNARLVQLEAEFAFVVGDTRLEPVTFCGEKRSSQQRRDASLAR